MTDILDMSITSIAEFDIGSIQLELPEKEKLCAICFGLEEVVNPCVVKENHPSACKVSKYLFQ
jgi:hypothetical protein